MNKAKTNHVFFKRDGKTENFGNLSIDKLPILLFYIRWVFLSIQSPNGNKRAV